MKKIESIIQVNEYKFKNYTVLSETESEIALKFRNDNKKWMINDKEISLEEHLKWIESLKHNDKIIYYLVFKDNKPFMAIDYHDIDWNLKEAYWGYFLGDKNYTSEVLKIEKIIIDIAFNKLGLNKLICLNDINNSVINIHKFFGFKEDGIVTINNREFLKMYLIKED